MITEIKSLDIGTMYLVGASRFDKDKICFKKLRHAFLKIKTEPSMYSFLKEEDLQYTEINDDIYVLSDSAFKMAYTMGKNISRPMQDGILNPEENKSELILKILVNALIGKADNKKSICYYSIPAEPFEDEYRVVYHSGIIQEILESLGYQAQEVNEGLAVVYSSLSNNDFTGIGISCGCGLLNVCLSFMGKPIESFSIDRAGDWIDTNVAKVLGEQASKITKVKEKGIDLLAPQDRIERAISIYYKELIRYAVDCIKTRLKNCGSLFVFDKPIDIVCGGGTSLPEGFISIFNDEISETKLPLDIKNVHLAEDPLYAVARGCFINAIADENHNEAVSKRKIFRNKAEDKEETESDNIDMTETPIDDEQVDAEIKKLDEKFSKNEDLVDESNDEESANVELANKDKTTDASLEN